eukprot:SM000003S11170  [mRNA]  locus=s3:1358625:1363171:- [translate_table: standard]
MAAPAAEAGESDGDGRPLPPLSSSPAGAGLGTAPSDASAGAAANGGNAATGGTSLPPARIVCAVGGPATSFENQVSHYIAVAAFRSDCQRLLEEGSDAEPLLSLPALLSRHCQRIVGRARSWRVSDPAAAGEPNDADDHLSVENLQLAPVEEEVERVLSQFQLGPADSNGGGHGPAVSVVAAASGAPMDTSQCGRNDGGAAAATSSGGSENAEGGVLAHMATPACPAPAVAAAADGASASENLAKEGGGKKRARGRPRDEADRWLDAQQGGIAAAHPGGAQSLMEGGAATVPQAAALCRALLPTCLSAAASSAITEEEGGLRGGRREGSGEAEEEMERAQQQRVSAVSPALARRCGEAQGCASACRPLDPLQPLPLHPSVTAAASAHSSPREGCTGPALQADVEESEVVLCVTVHHNHKRRKVKGQEMLVLGSQRLTALRDAIICQADRVMRLNGIAVPSGYFVIEDVFYNDLRDAEAEDYSAAVREWRASQAEASDGAPPRPWAAKDMHATTFADLRLRVGALYLYCHQGDCKHIVCFLDVRRLHQQDPHQSSAYPVVLHKPKYWLRRCSVCHRHTAEKVTIDDKLAPERVSLFCEPCYFNLHYSKDGKLLYDDFSPTYGATIAGYFAELCDFARLSKLHMYRIFSTRKLSSSPSTACQSKAVYGWETRQSDKNCRMESLTHAFANNHPAYSCAMCTLEQDKCLMENGGGIQEQQERMEERTRIAARQEPLGSQDSWSAEPTSLSGWCRFFFENVEKKSASATSYPGILAKPGK